jgi:hypothetical protein
MRVYPPDESFDGREVGRTLTGVCVGTMAYTPE